MFTSLALEIYVLNMHESIWNGANSEILSTWIGPEETAILLHARGLAAVYQDWRRLDSMGDV